MPHCVRANGHKGLKHRDPYGVEWSDAGQMSGDAARAHQDEQLRKLRSFCIVEAERMRGHFNPPPASDAYDDIATRLGEILDGEE